MASWSIRENGTGSWWCTTGCQEWCRRSRGRRNSHTVNLTGHETAGGRIMKMIPPAFVCGDETMRRTAFFLVTVVLATIVAGCAPEDSLFPLYTKDESLFNERLIGVWRMQESPTEPKAEDSYVIFSDGKAKATYFVPSVQRTEP